MKRVFGAAPAPAASTSGGITELCNLAEKAWLGLLGFLAFFAVVILSTVDSDFLVGSKQTHIPLIGIAVPTERFFLLAPIVGTVLYCQLHLYCIKLWYAARDADTALFEKYRPTSLIGDIAYYMKPGTEPRGGKLTNLGTVAAALLIWCAHPLLLVAAIARSQASARVSASDSDHWVFLSRLAHGDVEAVVLTCLAISAALGTASLVIAWAIPEPPDSNRRLRLLPLAVLAAAVLPIVFSGDIGRLRTTPVSLDRQNLAGVSAGWPLVDESRAAFRDEWCRTQGVPKAFCGNVPARVRRDAETIEGRRQEWCKEKGAATVEGKPCAMFFAELDKDFQAEWNATRRAELGRVPALDLEGRHLSGASAVGAKFIGARMERIDLVSANLKSANLEGADLLDARLGKVWGQYASFDRSNLTKTDLTDANLTSANFEGADLVETVLQGANLVDAHLVGANLKDADLRGANLTNARLTGANLTGADLRGANLTNALLQGAHLPQAQLMGAILTGADLRDATGLSLYEMADAIGDESTRLPEANPALFVSNCWSETPSIVEAITARLPETSTAVAIRKAIERQSCDRGDRVVHHPRHAITPPESSPPAVAEPPAKLSNWAGDAKAAVFDPAIGLVVSSSGR